MKDFRSNSFWQLARLIFHLDLEHWSRVLKDFRPISSWVELLSSFIQNTKTETGHRKIFVLTLYGWSFFQVSFKALKQNAERFIFGPTLSGSWLDFLSFKALKQSAERFSSHLFMGWTSFKFHSDHQNGNRTPKDFLSQLFLAAGLTFFHILEHRTHTKDIRHYSFCAFWPSLLSLINFIQST